MAQLINLIPELLLNVASCLPQVDLLNVTLTCKRLRAITEPELFREYINHNFIGPSFLRFVRRLLKSPELAKYVHRLDIRPWTTMSSLAPDLEHHMWKSKGIPKDDYELLTQAAKSAGVISNIFPYEAKSAVLEKLRALEYDDSWGYGDANEAPWDENIFEPGKPNNDVPDDQRFCQLLRIGLEDPIVILLSALLPNVREVDLRGAPEDQYALSWRSSHQFRALKRLTIRSMDGDLEFPLGYCNEQLQGGKLEVLEAYSCGSWWRRITGPLPEEWIPRAMSLEPKSLDLSRIVLQYSTLMVSDMAVLLNACRALSSFYLSVGGMKVGPQSLTTVQVISLLIPHRNTLKELFLDMFTEWDFPFEDEPAQSLSNLRSLTTLDMDAETLSIYEADQPHPLLREEITIPVSERLYNRLPRSLQHLTIRDVDNDEVGWRHIDDLLAVRSELFPDLESLEVLMDTMYQPRVLPAKSGKTASGKPFYAECRPVTQADSNQTVFIGSNGKLTSLVEAVIWHEDNYYTAVSGYNRQKLQKYPMLDNSFSSEDESVESANEDESTDGSAIDEEIFEEPTSAAIEDCG